MEAITLHDMPRMYGIVAVLVIIAFVVNALLLRAEHARLGASLALMWCSSTWAPVSGMSSMIFQALCRRAVGEQVLLGAPALVDVDAARDERVGGEGEIRAAFGVAGVGHDRNAGGEVVVPLLWSDEEVTGHDDPHARMLAMTDVELAAAVAEEAGALLLALRESGEAEGKALGALGDRPRG